MKILVVGASGFLGHSLIQELSRHHSVVGTFHSKPVSGMVKLDLNNSAEIVSVLNRINPDCIVLAAAEANVDAYETDKSISISQISSAKKISVWCKKKNALLVFISTDFVFDGEKGNYSESDKTNPITAYGLNKLDIEKIVSGVEKHLVLRTSTLYGLPFISPKFINSAIQKLSKGEKVSAVSDWKRSPTLTRDIAVALVKLLEKKKFGLFHCSGKSKVSMFDCAVAIAKEFNVSENLVSKLSGKELKLASKRPVDTTLDISKIESLGIRMSTIEEGIKFIHSEMEKK